MGTACLSLEGKQNGVTVVPTCVPAQARALLTEKEAERFVTSPRDVTGPRGRSH